MQDSLTHIEHLLRRLRRAYASGSPAERSTALLRLYCGHGAPLGHCRRAIELWYRFGTWTTQN